MKLVDAIHQRLTDWRRERRIQRLIRRITYLQALGRSGRDKLGIDYRPTWDLLSTEIEARSPQQVARLERRIGR